MNDDYDEDDYDEDKSYDEDKEKNMRLQSTNFYQNDHLSCFDHTKYCAPVMFEAKGTLTGDINWNNAEAQIKIHFPFKIELKSEHDLILGESKKIPYRATWSAKISPFTANCGVKALHHLWCDNWGQDAQLFLSILESFLYYCCNCGIVVGSDTVGGSTGDMIRQYGTGYVMSEPVWNPNYTWDHGHKIFLFHKYLDKNALVDYWG